MIKSPDEKPLLGVLPGILLCFATGIITAIIAAISAVVGGSANPLNATACVPLFQCYYSLVIVVLLTVSKFRRSMDQSPKTFDHISNIVILIATLFPYIFVPVWGSGEPIKTLIRGICTITLIQLVYIVPIIKLRNKAVKENLSPTRLGISFILTLVLTPILFGALLVVLVIWGLFTGQGKFFAG
jgi:hypothetical protein